MRKEDLTQEIKNFGMIQRFEERLDQEVGATIGLYILSKKTFAIKEINLKKISMDKLDRVVILIENKGIRQAFINPNKEKEIKESGQKLYVNEQEAQVEYLTHEELSIITDIFEMHLQEQKKDKSDDSSSRKGKNVTHSHSLSHISTDDLINQGQIYAMLLRIEDLPNHIKLHIAQTFGKIQQIIAERKKKQAEEEEIREGDLKRKQILDDDIESNDLKYTNRKEDVQKEEIHTTRRKNLRLKSSPLA